MSQADLPADEGLDPFGYPRTVIDDCEFSFDSDGDLQIDLDPEGLREGWRGHYFSREEAAQLRDWLTEVLK